MLTSLAFIFLLGLIMAAVFQRLKLPRIIGMLLIGIILGPYVLNLLDTSILSISADLRKMALVIILIKAGLSLKISDLKKVGRPALLMSFLPATFEIIAVTLFAPMLLPVSRAEAALLGSVLGAVSPAVVVPRMVQLMEENYGTKKGIPQMIMAAASLDDVFVIVVFTVFLGMVQGGNVQATDFFNIPISIILGIALGAATGFILASIFEACFKKQVMIRNSTKVIIVLGTAFLLLAIENWLENIISLSGLLAVMSMSIVIASRSVPTVTSRLQQKFGKLWLGSELILFVLVGAAVDISYALHAGIGALFLIFIGLFFRSFAVLICLMGTKLSPKERLYCIFSYLPKATVQAAIGGVPLSLGLSCGNLILSVAVLAILITAPLGAICMDKSCPKLLEKE